MKTLKTLILLIFCISLLLQHNLDVRSTESTWKPEVYINENLNDLQINKINDLTGITQSNIKLDQSINNFDNSVAIHVDKNNSIYLGGLLTDPSVAFKENAFFSNLNTSGEIVWSNIFANFSVISDIKTDSENNLILVMRTISRDLEPVGQSADYSYNGNSDIFLQKMDPNGNILWNTYWGGSEFDRMARLTIDSQDNIIIVGETNSNDFNITSDAFDQDLIDECFVPCQDGFITKFSKDGLLNFSTYLGGSDREENIRVQTDSDDNIIVTGATRSDDFPVSNNPYQNMINGQSDGFVTKLNPSGELLFSTYIGGGNFESGEGSAIDDLNNIIIVGSTFSTDFPVVNPIVSVSQGSRDGFISKFSKQGDLIWSSYYGGEHDDVIDSVSVDKVGNLFIAGETESDDFPSTSRDLLMENTLEKKIFINKITSRGDLVWGLTMGSGEGDDSVNLVQDNKGNLLHLGFTSSESFPLRNSYEFTFGGLDSVLSSLDADTGKVNWITRTVVITNPTLDQDGDNLDNHKEYEIKTNPLSTDTDEDGMADDWEYNKLLDPLNDDALEDPDMDNLENIREFSIKTDPFNSDSDYDGMPDGWEFDNFLNPLIDDHDSDRIDKDGMPALWEYLMELNPVIVDNSSDKDGDGLSNLFEWQYTGNYTFGLSAKNPDTDGDGMTDGWEIKNGLNPLMNDANEDPDNDFLNNGIEFKYGLDPNDRRELYAMIILLFLISIGLIFVFLKIRSINNQAKIESYRNFWDKRKSFQAGFETQKERIDAKNRGFLTKEIRDIVIATGHESIDIVKESWIQRNSALISEIDDFDLDETIFEIRDTRSPQGLIRKQSEIDKKLSRFINYNVKLNNQIALQDTLINLASKAKSKLIVGISRDYIETNRSTSNEISHRLYEIIRTIQNELETRKEWFQPWEALLTLIQITPDGKPINISEIMQVINRSEDHAEVLLVALLIENAKIGSYDTKTKSYMKASNIDQYLELALSRMKDPLTDQEN